MKELRKAFEDTAKHFQVEPDEVTRKMMRSTRKDGIHSVSDWKLRPFQLVKARALGEGVVAEGHYVKAVSSYIDSEGKVRAQWVKTDTKAQTREETLKRLFAELEDVVPTRTESIAPPFEAENDDLLDVYPMGDPHIGMMSWAPETGADFDLNIARSVTEAAIDHLTAGAQASRALILNLGDFFHSDTLKNTTARGTPVDVDGRMMKVLRVGVDLMVYTIDAALRSHEQVDVHNCVGNHDTLTSVFLSIALEKYYRNEPRVTVHPNHSNFFYLPFGKVLLGATHGHGPKPEQLGAIMAADQPELWGKTEHRHWLMGHVHHRSVKEVHGATVETFNTLAGRDSWHHNEGYRSNRNMNRITYHQFDGEIGRETINASALKRRYGTLTGEAK